MKKIFIYVLSILLCVNSVYVPIYAEEVNNDSTINYYTQDDLQGLLDELSLFNIEDIKEEDIEEITNKLTIIKEIIITLDEETLLLYDLNHYYELIEYTESYIPQDSIENNFPQEDDPLEDPNNNPEEPFQDPENDSLEGLNDPIDNNSSDDQDEIGKIELDNVPILNYRTPKFDESKIKHAPKNNLPQATTLPSKYSLIDKGYISPIRNQNPYGTCWAFAAIASAESNYKIKNGSFIDLSEMQLGWFTYGNYQVADPLNLIKNDGTYVPDNLFDDTTDNSKNDSRLNAGGNSQMATTSLASGIGLIKENDLPYVNELGTNFNFPDNSLCYKSNYLLRSTDVYSLDEKEEIKKAVMEKGALAISFYFYSDDQYYYYFGTDGNSFYSGDKDNPFTNHAVNIVGWDDSYSRTKFSGMNGKKPAKNGAWLVRNSWGVEWGNLDGYFWISYEEPTIRNDLATSFAIESIDSGDSIHIYQYDGSAAGTDFLYDYYPSDYPLIQAANLYTAQRDELLTDVGIFSDNSEIGYEIDIYTNVDGTSDPTNGTLAYYEEGYIEDAGYHLIKLQEPVLIDDGDHYSVVITLIDLIGDQIVYPVDYDLEYVNGYHYYNDMTNDISFISTVENGLNFERIDNVTGEECVARIKAICKEQSDTPKYKIEHYYENLSGTYDKQYVQTKQGEASTSVTATPNELDDTLYTFNESHPSTVKTGTIAENGSLVLKLYYDRKEYSITYNTAGGTTIAPESYKWGATITPPNDPYRLGYTFEGWNPEIPDIMQTENITVTAKWKTSPIYTITYVTNGGTISKTAVYDKKYSSETPTFDLVQSSEITRNGYTFAGWYIDKELTQDTDTYLKGELKRNISLFAKWTPKDYSLTYELNGGTLSTPNPVTYNIETDTFILSEPTKENYDFIGWTSSDILSPTLNLSINKGSFGDKTFTANYRGVSHQITYVLNGGTNSSLNPSLYYYGEGVGSFENPYRIKYQFEGWYSKDGTGDDWGQAVTSISSTKLEDVTIYAKWSLKYQVDTPTSSIATGSTINKDTLIELSCTTEDATIYYVIDSNDPQIYTEPFTLESSSTDSTVKIYAKHADMIDSNDATYSYNIEGYNLSDTEIDSVDLINNNREVTISSYDDIPEGLWCSKLTDMTYTGKALTQDFRVYFNEKKLTLNTDYTVKYSNNTKAGTATVTVTGKGNYASTFTTSFTINPKQTELIENPTIYLIATGKPLSVSAPKVVTIDGVTLKNNTDYTYVLLDSSNDPVLNNKPTSSGTYYMCVTSTDTSNYHFDNNYNSNTSYKLYEVIVQDTKTYKISSAKINNFKTSYDYTGSNIEQDISLTYTINKVPTTLNEGTDYEVHYYNNKEIGTATMVIEGIGDYYGSITKTYKINGIALSKAKFEYNNEPFKSILNQTYTGEEIEIGGISLYYQSNTRVDLAKGTDYTVSYEKNINAGTATILFTGKGIYTGTVKKTFKITAYSLDDADADFSIENIDSQIHLKGGAKPDIEASFKGTELVLNKDYTLSYKNNTKTGTATVTIKGKGNYSGSVIREFTIEQSDISKLDITVPDKAYANKAGAYKSAVTITDSDGKKLSAGSDYEKEIKYTYVYDTAVIDSSIKTKPIIIRHADDEVGTKDIIPIGAVLKATVTAKGNYSGTTSKTFRIVANDISKATVKIPTQYYTGKPIYLSKGDLDITFNKLPLSYEDYDIVSYTNNTAKGSASVTIRGKGDFGGYKTIKFTIQNRSIGFTIKFDPNGGTGTMKDQVITKNTALTANKFKWSGKVFKGWSTSKNGPKTYDDKQPFTYTSLIAGQTIILYAIWE